MLALNGAIKRIGASNWGVYGGEETPYLIDTARMSCNCQDFVARSGSDPNFRCKHLWAVIFTRVCERCGHTWVPRVPQPKHCPKCNSPHWDFPAFVR